MLVKETTAITVILVVVIIVAGGLMYSALPRIFDAIDKFLTGDWAGNLTGGNQSQSGFNMGLGVLITFRDGSTKVVEPQALTIYPMTLYFEGQEISTITYTAEAKMSWRGTMTGLSQVSGAIHEVWEMPPSASHVEIGFNNFEGALTVPAQDTWFKVSASVITADDIEAGIVALGDVEGDYLVNTHYPINLEATFADGVTDGASETDRVDLTISYTTSGIELLELKITQLPS